MNKQKISLTQEIHSLHLENPLRKNVIRLLVCVPFSLGSVFFVYEKGYILHEKIISEKYKKSLTT